MDIVAMPSRNMFSLLLLLNKICGGFEEMENTNQDIPPGFHIGRLSEGQFEHPQHNGWMAPAEAAKFCDSDPQCGGFTYKGTQLMDRQFQIYFFHIVINIEENSGSWKWIYYKSNKTFLDFPGIFRVTETLDNSWGSDLDFGWACAEEPNCLGLELPQNRPLKYINLDKLRHLPGQSTLVKIKNVNNKTKIDSTSSYDGIDICCPKSGEVDTAKVLATVKDTFERIPCNMPQKEFFQSYVLRKKVAVLVNCSVSWRAQSHWSLSSLVEMQGGRWQWGADWKVEGRQDLDKFEMLDGKILQELLSTNGSLVKIFDKLAKRAHTRHMPENEPISSYKKDLFLDYSTPAPLMDTDRFWRAGLLTDYQWVLASTKDTGTELHTDPQFTSPWNTVTQGHKWWAFLPGDVDPDAFLCDTSCSKDEEEDITVLSWYNHVLPQLRKRKFYGESVAELILGPGETLYLPGNIAHSVMNIDETVSVTENYFLPDSLEDWIHGVMSGEDLILTYSNNTDYEIFWRSMYYRQMDSSERALVRSMREQVENMAMKNPEKCQEEEEEEEEEEDDEEEEDEDDGEDE